MGLDSAAFDTCLDSGQYTEAVQQQTSTAQQLGVQSTPSFVANGQPIIGAQPFENFVQVFQSLTQ